MTSADLPTRTLPPVHRTSPRPTVWTRLHFGWAALWGGIWTTLFTPCVLVHALIRPGAKTLKLWMTVWARSILFFAGIRVRCTQHAALDPDQPVVFVANHQNSLDILTAAGYIPHAFGFTAKEPLRRMPFIGWVLANTSSVFVDRSTPRKAIQSMREAGAQIREGDAVLMFCEGQRTYSTELGPFLRGAFMLAVEAGVPIVPVVIDGDVGLLDERVGASRPGWVHLTLGEPIDTAQMARGDVPALMDTVRGWMAGHLDLPTPDGAAG